MKLKTVLITFALLVSAVAMFAQEAKEEFKPYGKPFIKIFTNYHSTFSDGEASRVFEIQRAYLGYQVQLSEKFSGKLNIDVGDPGFGTLKMTAYLKNAYMQYASGKLVAQIGMIGLQQYKMQEDLWAGRYLYKSFMDEYKFGPSADLGAFVAYQFHERVSADITIANGNGYKSIQSDTALKYSLGLTLEPVNGLDFRASYDYMGKDSPQQTMALYLGYSREKVKIGAEYNYQLNYKMVESQDQYGVSFYGSYQARHTRFFGRYDRLSSVTIGSDTDPWNYGNDGQVFIAGVEFNPVKGIMITPNYQGWVPADGSSLLHSAYLSIEIKF
jgi:hypothetical protein